jgi:Gly-Xaa carboxypeptidase
VYWLISKANTDTRAMWNLSKHIYRFTPAFVEENKNVHTVDEVSESQQQSSNLADRQRISVAGHLNTTRYFYKLLRNAEGWKSD